MKHLKLTVVGLLALTTAASGAFAFGPPPHPPMGGGLPRFPMGGGLPHLPMGGGLPHLPMGGGGPVGNTAARGPAGNVTGSGKLLGRICGRRRYRSRGRSGSRLERQVVNEL
jgi:hypothetical protein